jgi:diketogulonate reductase-like aldo/keto reductase
VSVQVPAVTLNNGVEMPILGFGVFQIPTEQTGQAVADALAAGYRHLDTAASYGNEQAVGRAIAASGIARTELFVTTKLWVQDTGESNTKKAFDASLQRLGLDYLDLYLIHQPYGDYYGSWRAMRALNEQGLIKAIGVANFYPDRLVDLIDRTGFTPAVNQIETHPYFQRQADHDLMAGRGVQHESWGGFAEGRNNLFSDPPWPRSAPPTASPSPRSCCAGSPSATSSSSPSRSGPSGWRRTSTSSTSLSPATRWPASPPWTPAPRCSSTTATQPWSAPSETAPSTTDDPP